MSTNPYRAIPYSVRCILSNGLKEEVEFYKSMKDTKASFGQIRNAQVCADNAKYFQGQLDLVKEAMSLP